MLGLTLIPLRRLALQHAIPEAPRHRGLPAKQVVASSSVLRPSPAQPVCQLKPTFAGENYPPQVSGTGTATAPHELPGPATSFRTSDQQLGQRWGRYTNTGVSVTASTSSGTAVGNREPPGQSRRLPVRGTTAFETGDARRHRSSWSTSPHHAAPQRHNPSAPRSGRD